ncbi:MAG: hypothetical protein F6J93_07700 [Oscillatoria sp. SIO1A7]|nr:hypothetical protein [Oscillatoria sp. SIO1A7]
MWGKEINTPLNPTAYTLNKGKRAYSHWALSRKVANRYEVSLHPTPHPLNRRGCPMPFCSMRNSQF